MTPVLFIAYYFPPAAGAGAYRSEKFVRYLPSQGFAPIVVTGPGAVGDRWTPTDVRLGEGLGDNVEILRAKGPVPQNGNHWTSRMGRWVLPNDAFARWWIDAGIQVAGQAMNGAKLIFATMSPFVSAEIAFEISRRSGMPWIADLRDPWALDEMQIFQSRIHRKLELRRMHRLLSDAAGIVLNTPEAKEALLESFPSLKAKCITTITNGYDDADFAEDLAPRTDGKFRIVHTGYLHTDLGIQVRAKRAFYELLGGIDAGVDVLTRSHVVLLEALERWVTRRPEIAQKLEIVFAGVASEQDKAVANASRLAQLIRFTGYVPHSESVRLIRTADLLFLPMHNVCAGRRARIVPGKTYEYMATGRPILGAVPEGDARDFLQKSGVAWLCKPDDVQGMVEQLDRVYSGWEAQVSDATPNWEFIKEFERSRLTHELASFFNQVLGTSDRNCCVTT